MKKVILLLVFFINVLVGKEIFFPINSYSLNTNEMGYFLYENRIIKYKVVYKNLDKKEICLKSLTKDFSFSHQCEIIDLNRFQDFGMAYEKVRFEIQKQMFLSLTEKIKRHDEYICDFGFINIKNEKFNLLVNLNKFNSTYLDFYSFEYYKKNKEKILVAFRDFFYSRLSGDFCKVNSNLIYNDIKNKPPELFKTENHSSTFDDFEFDTFKH